GPQGDEAELRRGVVLFNAGLYFECHELLEGVWRATPGPERAFYHGIVQAAAAFYHYEKRNLHGARTLLTKGLQKLEGFPYHYRGVNLGAFRRMLRPWLEQFNAGVSNEPDALPGNFSRYRIYLVTLNELSTASNRSSASRPACVTRILTRYSGASLDAARYPTTVV